MTAYQNNTGGKRWVPETAAAEFLGLSRALLAKDRSRRHLGIPFVRIGRAIRYDLKALETWMEAKAGEDGN